MHTSIDVLLVGEDDPVFAKDADIKATVRRLIYYIALDAKPAPSL